MTRPMHLRSTLRPAHREAGRKTRYRRLAKPHRAGRTSQFCDWRIRGAEPLQPIVEPFFPAVPFPHVTCWTPKEVSEDNESSFPLHRDFPSANV